VLSGGGFTEEGVEGVIAGWGSLDGGHVTIFGDSVLEAVEFPAVVTDLDTGLTEMDGDTFTHD